MMIRRFSLAAACLAAASCARDLPGDDPPGRAFYYPISLEAAPDGAHVFVVSSNFDLRYNTGWISRIDLDRLPAAGAPAIQGTSPIVDEPELRILPLAGDMAVSPTGSMAVIPHRGEPRLTLVEIDQASALSCGDPGATSGLSMPERRTDCDRAHIYELDAAAFPGELAEAAVDDPYAVALTAYEDGGEPQPVAVVGHLAVGRLATFRVTAGWQVGQAPELEAALSLILRDSGVTSLVVHPDASGTFVTATSRGVGGRGAVDSSIYVIDIGRSLREEQSRVFWHEMSQWVGGRDIVDMAFSPDGSLAFVSNRGRELTVGPLADGLIMLDASIETIEEVDPDGTIRRVEYPRLSVIGEAPAAGRPSAVTYVTRASGPDLVAAASFDRDLVMIFELRGASLYPVARLDDVGSGPFDMLHVTYGARELLLVASFFDHTVSVFDCTDPQPIRMSRIATIKSDETAVVDRDG